MAHSGAGDGSRRDDLGGIMARFNSHRAVRTPGCPDRVIGRGLFRLEKNQFAEVGGIPGRDTPVAALFEDSRGHFGWASER